MCLIIYRMREWGACAECNLSFHGLNVRCVDHRALVITLYFDICVGDRHAQLHALPGDIGVASMACDEGLEYRGGLLGRASLPGPSATRRSQAALTRGPLRAAAETH